MINLSIYRTEEMTQQQKIVYYFLRSGNDLGLETTADKPIPKRDMSLMESTDLSERVGREESRDSRRRSRTNIFFHTIKQAKFCELLKICCFM